MQHDDPVRLRECRPAAALVAVSGVADDKMVDARTSQKHSHSNVIIVRR